MPTPLNVPVVEGGLLDQLLADWDDHGWNLSDLRSLRMAVDDDVDDDEEEEDDEDLEEEEDDDEDDDRRRRRSVDARVAKANKEAANRRRELKPWKDLARELDMTPEQIRDAIGKKKPAGGGKDKDDAEDKPDLDALRRDVERETTAKANRRIVRSEIKAIAADQFADPADAPLYLELDDYDVDDEGEVDENQIREDLKALLKRKPHLAKKPEDGDTSSGNGRRRPKPDRAQGKGGKPLTGADAGRAEAERRFGDKAKAKAAAS